MQVSPDEERNNLEVCPSAGIIIQEVTKRILQHGGFSLFADYGHSGEKGGTFRVGVPYVYCKTFFGREVSSKWAQVMKIFF